MKAGNRVVHQPESYGLSYIESLTTGRKKRIYERNGIYVLPAWVVKQRGAATAPQLAPISGAQGQAQKP